MVRLTMNKSVFFITMISLFTSVNSKNGCILIEEILSNKKVVDYLHPDSKNRSTLYLVKNDLCNFNGKIGKINVISTEEVTAIKNINYLKVISVKKVKKGKVISLSYPIEGVLFEIHFNDANDILKVDVLEH